MDRTIVYPIQEPLETDMLNAYRDAMIAIGGVLQAAFGLGTSVFGLAASPVSPAGLGVTIGIGGIITESVVDSSAYSSLGVNNNALMKMGMNYAPVTLPLTAPATAGYSQIYLVQVEFVETDGSPEILPYLNPDNIDQALAGPGGDSDPQNTRRTQSAVLSLVAGTPAATGSQGAPATSPGNVPLYYVTVANGQTSIISSNIVQAPNSPFLPNDIPGLRIPVVGGTLNVYVSSTGNDANSGTSASAPFLTINGALAAVEAQYDLSSVTLQINLAAGSYGQFTVDGTNIKSKVLIQGAGSTVTTITGTTDNTVNVLYGGYCTVSGVKLTNTNPTGTGLVGGATCVFANNGSVFLIGSDVNFGTSAHGNHLWTAGAATISSDTVGRPYTISGSAGSHYFATTAGSINLVDAVVTLTGTPAFPSAFAYATQAGTISVYGNTYSGSATGQRYSAANNAIIVTNGAGASYLPGSSAGVTSNGGLYT